MAKKEKFHLAKPFEHQFISGDPFQENATSLILGTIYPCNCDENNKEADPFRNFKCDYYLWK